MCLAAHTEFDFKQMLTALPASPGETGAVDPYWDPLNPEHGFPRNLVSSSIWARRQGAPLFAAFRNRGLPYHTLP